MWYDFVDFLFNNSIVIDKSVYVTTLIGELTVSAIYLNFCQFIAGHGDNGEHLYLGVNLADFYYKDNLSVITRLIKSRVFFLSIIFQIFYKPVVAVFGHRFQAGKLCFFNCLWYGITAVFFTLFIYVILNCIRYVYDANGYFSKNKKIIKTKRNHRFLKNCIGDLIRKSRIEIQCNKYEMINGFTKADEDKVYVEDYADLVELVMNPYTCYGIKNGLLVRVLYFIEKRKRKPYIFNKEVQLLRNMAENSYFYDCKKYQGLLIRNLKKLIEDNTEYIQADGAKDYYLNNRYDKQLEEIAEHIFKENNSDIKNMLIEFFKQAVGKNDITCAILRHILIEWLNKVAYEEVEEEEVKKIFKSLRFVDDELGIDYIIFDVLKENNYSKEFADNVPEILNPTKATNVLISLVMYFAIYKFRFDWKYIDIDLLRNIAKKEMVCNIKGQGYPFDEKTDIRYKNKVQSFIRKTCFSHRFESDMLDYIFATSDVTITTEWIDNTYKSFPELAFYWIVIKLLVFHNDFNLWGVKGDLNFKVMFINEISKHPELLAYSGMRDFLMDLKSHCLGDVKGLPKELRISFNSLLLIGADLDALSEKNTELYLDKHSGKYCLYKLSNFEGSIDNEKKKKLYDVVKESFRNYNCKEEEYVQTIVDDAKKVGWEINYINAEKMKKLLNEINAS
ncbi:hypothetical protein NXH64_04545 [Butyrivibrio fibrisolvens]|uniref:hypothetical protein n=1 Tax=Pseudobutyrivibrio ruminis TaxID=46206 RepID=UPI000400D627|nr:hypothetical protein [Pseudobutyrivibrio ruminis]MDC7278769.1 hypothetical protein [Butyrivibrio fibrisolvens]